ncbi:MAG TPA: hypothetical protein VM843_08790 [Flavisolibacter sp.]|nr:hypothetical protein [Flavisolibacter sp.]
MRLKLFFSTLLLAFLTVSVINGQTPDTAEQSASATQSQDTPLPGDDYEDDFSPGMLFFALIGIGSVCILVGIGIALGTAGLLLTFALVSAGILSTSVLVGLKKKSVTKGFRTLLYVSSAVGGVAVASAGLYLINRFYDLQLAAPTALVIGALSGGAGGILLGYLLQLMLIRLSAYFRQRLNLG